MLSSLMSTWGWNSKKSSPFEAASRLLVWSQNQPGKLADELRKILHKELYAQLEQEQAAATPLMQAWARSAEK